MPSALAKASQRGFAAGMFRIAARDRIPENGAWNLENCLIDGAGDAPRRGGTAYLSAAFLSPPDVSAGLTWVWDGFVRGARRTFVANEANFGVLAGDGSTVTNLLGGGLPFPIRAVSFGDHLYLRDGLRTDGDVVAAAQKSAEFYAVAGGRLIALEGNRISMGPTASEEAFDESEFHELPDGVRIIGGEGTRDRLAVFTTQGVWTVSNVELDLTDTDGNVQQSLDRVSRNLVLWADSGLAGWQGGLVVPAIDGVWLMAIGQDVVTGPPPFRRISEPIDPLYQEYVRVGYRPGGAVVHNGHYFLPILNGPSVVDQLVCRLDTGAWTHNSGHGAYLSALTVRVTPGGPQPQLLGAQRDASSRVSRLDYFSDPSTDADGSWAPWDIVTRDFTTGAQTKSFVKKARAEFLLTDTTGTDPTVTASYGREEPAFSSTVNWDETTWDDATWEESDEGFTTLTGTASEDATGALPYVWRVNKNAERIRFRLRVSAGSGKARMRSLEVHLRPTGRF